MCTVIVYLCVPQLACWETMDVHLWEVNEWITGCPGWMLDSSHPRNAEEGKCLPQIDRYIFTRMRTRTHIRTHTPTHTHTHTKVRIAHIPTVHLSHQHKANKLLSRFAFPGGKKTDFWKSEWNYKTLNLIRLTFWLLFHFKVKSTKTVIIFNISCFSETDGQREELFTV